MNATSKYSSGQITWQCPSNIALVKYWGKSDGQIPMNPSLSMTLKKSHTITELSFKKGQGLSFCFAGKPKDSFKERIQTYLKQLSQDLMDHYKLTIETRNSFPHSAGIASSASGMGALALCLGDLMEENHSENFFKMASHMARLASGSACRSVYGGVVSWGEISNEYASPVKEVHQVFQGMKNSIILIDQGEKAISSSRGHDLMKDHPYRDARIKQACNNYFNLKKALKLGNLKDFGEIVEGEAMSLHALMMSSSKAFSLMKPLTLEVIQQIRAFRRERALDAYFTLDAGPNIHLLYPEDQKKSVREFLDKLDHPVIHDEMGEGPRQITCKRELP
jgi:diphosphomevalonate decarboxylase